MLILTRKPGEQIVIDGDIVVKVVNVTPSGVVKLGFTAPREKLIDREEVARRRAAERRERGEALP